MQKELITITAISLLVACSSPIKHKQPKVQPLIVQTQVVGVHTAPASVRYVGTVEAVNETPVSMQTAGRVLTVLCKDGERVHKDQLLLSIDNTQALNALRSAEATLRQAQDGYDRLNKVHTQGAVTDQQMVDIESKLAQAIALRDAAQKQVNECELKAPCDGLVSGLNLSPGQTIIPGARLLTLLDVSAYSARFTVPETEINTISISQTGYMECPAVDSILPCCIVEKSLQANPLSHTYDVKADIQGGRDILRPGMVCKVQLTAAQFQNKASVTIPAHCVHLLQQGPAVWLMQNGKAVRVPVQVGGYLADGVLITEGLQVGDTLITDGYQKLYHGATIVSKE